MLKAITISHVWVLDQDAALDFYIGKLGLEVRSDIDLGFMRWLTVGVLGDAICAAIGAGLYPDLSAAGEAMVQVAEVLPPTAAHRAVYDELFGVYRAAYPALKPLFAPLAHAARARPAIRSA